MDLSALHVAVRSVVRDGAEAASVPGAEGKALQGWQRRVRAMPGDMAKVVPTAPAREWYLQPEPFTD